jgi:hypothetical protein
MTTLFKKLSITTLALAVAGGIVVSVGSSEPSTFEGQATTVPGLFTLTLSDQTFSSNETTVIKTAGLTVTFTATGTTSSTFPLVATSTSVGLNVKNVTNNHIREIRSITVNTTASSSISITLQNLVQPNGTVGTGTSGPTSLTSGVRLDTSIINGESFPDTFSLTVTGADATPRAQINSVVITYDC